MVPLDIMTIALVCSSFCYTLALLYVVGLVLRPPLTSAINGLIALARFATERTGNRN